MYNVDMKRLFVFFGLIFILLVWPRVSLAQNDYRSDYTVGYYLSDNGGNISTQVRFNVQITNLRTEVYVKKFSISFPKSFGISNLSAKDDRGPIEVKSSEDAEKLNLEMEFSNPNTGRDSTNTFYLSFNQDNLFKVNGNVWEVIIPTIENKDNGNYQVIVNLPPDSSKKISLSKPAPTSISGHQIVWTNTPNRTIYAVFGDKQYYEAELVYHLKNPRIAPVYTEIALPPDTTYQKIYVENLDPLPSATYMDEDGNFIAKYYLSPQETKNITYKTLIEATTEPREEVIDYYNGRLQAQKKFLLSDLGVWKFPETAVNPKLTDIDQIYYYVVNSLSYNFEQIGKNKKRLSVAEILKKPTQAVCLEFTDLFVALAREKGFYSREIEGYGFSHEAAFRPISLTGDLLHAWPDFYDPRLKIWRQVDPTWENTSGIDYFSSFDLNHIAFVIHGRDPDYPVPAGMYKLDKSEDITIKAVAEGIRENKQVQIEKIDLSSEINDNKQYQMKIYVKNTGNVFQYGITGKLKSEEIAFDGNVVKIDAIAPMEKKEVLVNYSSKLKNKIKTAKISIDLGGSSRTELIRIIPYYYAIVRKMCLILLLFSGGFLVVKLAIRRHGHQTRTK